MTADNRRDRSAEEVVCNATEMVVEPEVPSETEKKFGKHSMRRKCRTGAESGTCNVCSAPCSSCMHRNLACMGPKDDEFSDETGRVTVISHCSVNNGDAHTASEASNMLSLNSSHDSLSENAESKVNTRSSDMVDASVKSEMLPKLFSGDMTEDHLSSKPHHLLDHKNFSNEHEDYESVLADDDNMQCIRGEDDVGITVKCRNKSIDKKNASCSSALDSCLESEGFEKALLADSSDPLDTPSDNVDAGISIPKVQRKYSSLSGNGTNLEGGPSFQVKKENTTEHLNLPLSKGAANHIGSDDNLSIHYIADNYGKSASKASSADYPKLEPDNRTGRDEVVENFKYPEQAGKDEKLNEAAELLDQQKPLPSLSGHESNELENLEHDVKVCDICGDAGREDLLAICSRCSDGAEHTYCMQEMLQKVPEGDWLCEECKLAEKIENQKQGSDLEGKMVEKDGIQSFQKRHAEDTELASASKREVIETSLGSPKPSSPNKIPALSRDSSFKSLDQGKAKPSRQVSFGNHSSVDIPDIARSSSFNPQLQTPKGTLLKSNSSNTLISKSKVRVVDKVLQKHKGAGENEKEDPATMMMKSMSFKSANPSHSNAAGSKVKMPSAKLSCVQDIKGLKQMKDRDSFERKQISKLDRPPVNSVATTSGVSMPKADQKLTPRGESSMVVSASNSRELKATQSDSKLGTLLRSTSSIARKGAEIPVTSARVSMTNIASVEQKLSQISPREEPSSSSSRTTERPSNNANENLLDGLPQSHDLSIQSEKTRESMVSCLRPTVTSRQKNTTCPKCKEIGHTAEYCTIIGSQDSDTDVCATKSVEGNSKGSKLKPSFEATMLKKPGTYRKRKESKQCNMLSASNMDVSGEIASFDQVSVSTKTKDRVSAGQINEQEVSLGTGSHKLKSYSTVKQLSLQSTDVFPCKAGSLNSISSVGMTGQALAGTSVFQRISTIPEHEPIWQGTFDLCRRGKPLDMYGGIQAHLSTCASAKVLEVVKRFPLKLIFDEVPRMSTWPEQFHGNGVKEDNIALYFFAKDVGSYESYKGLLDNLIKKDLALKGSFDGVELLVFPSTQLPENSQRWNMLFFLWGVFRARRSNSSDSIKISDIPTFNAPAAVLPSPENLWSRETAICDSSFDAARPLLAPDKPYLPLHQNPDKRLSSSLASSQKQGSRFDSKSLSYSATRSASLCPENRHTSFPQEEGNIQEFNVDPNAKPSASTSSIVNVSMETQVDVRGDASHARECTSYFKVYNVSNENLCVRATGDTEEMVEARDHHKGKVKLRRDLNESNGDMDIETPLEREQTHEGFNGWQSGCRKREYLSPLETATQTSGSSSKETPWSKVDGIFAEVYSKKPKTDTSGQYGCSISREGIALSDTFASHMSNLGSSSSVEKSRGKASVDKVIPEDVGTTERYFFPVDSHCAKDFWLGSNSMSWKERLSKDEDHAHDGAPNLELALGAESTSPSKGNLSFLVGMVGRNHNKSKPLDEVTKKEEEDGLSASLSLSLSFPFPDKEQNVKSVSKAELLPERHHVNTSLLLFSDK